MTNRDDRAKDFAARTINMLDKTKFSANELQVARLSLEYGYKTGAHEEQSASLFLRLKEKYFS